MTEARAILEQLGGPQTVDEEMQQFRRAARVLSSKQPRMIERYPNEWVAVYRGRVRAHTKTFKRLMTQIDRKGLPREHIIVRFIDKSERTMIL